MATVKFTSTEEFIHELEIEKDAGGVQGNVCRVTFHHKITGHGTDHVTLMAAAIVSHGNVLRLSRYCGENWGEGFKNAGEVDEKAKTERDQLGVELHRLGLDVRGGALL